MAPYLNFCCFPPLDQLTVIPVEQENISFTFLAEWNRDWTCVPFEAVLCYTISKGNLHPSTWDNLSLQSQGNPHVVDEHEASRSTYTATLSKKQFETHSEWLSSSTVHFTIRYRINTFAPWHWVQTQQGVKPGELILQTPLDVPKLDNLSDLLDLKQSWKSEKLSSTERATVFQLQTSDMIPRGSDEEELQTSGLGRVRNQSHYMALVRLEPYWVAPRQGKDFFYLSEDAVLCSILTKTGRYISIVTITGLHDNYTVIRSEADGSIAIAARNDGEQEIPFTALLSVATDLETSIASVMNEARKIVNDSPKLQDLARTASSLPEVKESVVENWLDGLAYCTWNGLGQNLTQEKILTALKNLSENEINISTLLIDDNWQTLGPTLYDYSEPFFRGWDRFEANTGACPEGLKGLITQIRNQYPKIHDIGVWHALMGYWGGLATDGELAKKYQTALTPSKLMIEVPSKVLSIAGSDLHQFYDDFYQFLESSGVTFVKTDVQHMLSQFTSRQDRLDLVSTYQSAWTTAYLKHFKGKAISCMSQVPQILWHTHLQTHTPRILLRNSDDFYPEIPASHPWHIWANAHNSLFTQHLNVLPDWDMFQTSHSFSGYHAAARCLSGGPVLITDVPGQHDIHLINQMTALTPSGRTIALRPLVARTLSAFDTYTDGPILKIGTTTTSGASIIGFFNIADHDVRCMTPITEFPGIFDPERLQKFSSGWYIVRSFKTGQIFGPFNITKFLDPSYAVEPSDLIYSTIQKADYDILTAYPLVSLPLGVDSGLVITVLGLLQQMSGAAAIQGFWDTDVQKSAETGTATVKTRLKALGKSFGVWLATTAGTILEVKAQIDGKDVGKIECSSDATRVGYLSAKQVPVDGDKGATGDDMLAFLVELDVLSAWKDLNASVGEGQVDEAEVILDVTKVAA